MHEGFIQTASEVKFLGGRIGFLDNGIFFDSSCKILATKQYLTFLARSSLSFLMWRGTLYAESIQLASSAQLFEAM